jgi:hypothetical protein
MKKILKNKQGQFLSVLILVITLFVVGITLFFLNHVNKQIYDKFDETFKAEPTLNNTEAHLAVQKFQGVEGSKIWDYAFLAIFIGMFIQMLMFSFASRTNIAFFWVFTLLGVVVLVVGTILSNIWQTMASNTEFVVTLARFPITNMILGSYYPTIISGIIFLGMIILFGKFPGQER